MKIKLTITNNFFLKYWGVLKIGHKEPHTVKAVEKTFGKWGYFTLPKIQIAMNL